MLKPAHDCHHVLVLAPNKAATVWLRWICRFNSTLSRQSDVCLNVNNISVKAQRFGKRCPSVGPTPCSYYRIAVHMVHVVAHRAAILPV